MNWIESYVPEFEKLVDKHRDGARRCREDVAVVDASSNYRIVAGRGEGITAGSDLSAAFGLSERELSFLEASLVSHRRVLLHGTRGAVLVFAEYLHAVGLLLVIRPHMEPAVLYRALCLTGRRPAACSQAYLGIGADFAVEESDCRLAEELFFYMDRIFADQPFSNVYARGCLIAHFAGYRPAMAEEPIDDLVASKEELARLHMFLFCLFFRLRRTAVPRDERDGSESICHIKFYSEQGTSFLKNTDDVTVRELLELPAFRDFSILETPNGVLLRMHLQRRGERAFQLHAVTEGEQFFDLQIAWLAAS